MELYRRFFPDASESKATEFVRSCTAETMAEFQGSLLGLGEVPAGSTNDEAHESIDDLPQEEVEPALA
jgi:hypothetical protein